MNNVRTHELYLLTILTCIAVRVLITIRPDFSNLNRALKLSSKNDSPGHFTTGAIVRRLP